MSAPATSISVMAVFLLNTCKFHGCDQLFPSLGELIQHIEESHIDYDPKTIEKNEIQQPPALPLSYVLRFYADGSRKENFEYKSSADQMRTADWLKKQKIRSQSQGISSVRSNCNTPTGSELDEEDVVSDSDSNDSWTTQEEFSSELILRMLSVNQAKDEKPYMCPVPGCTKRYKNVNGIKYHAKNGHRRDLRVKKNFKCHCGKSYKTAQSLRIHAIAHHGGQFPSSVTATLQNLVTAKVVPASSANGSATLTIGKPGLVTLTANPMLPVASSGSSDVVNMSSIASIVSSLQARSSSLSTIQPIVASVPTPSSQYQSLSSIMAQPAPNKTVSSITPAVITSIPLNSPVSPSTIFPNAASQQEQ